MLVVLGALWALWIACWLRRVELRREHETTVRALGLAWVREGLGPSVRAAGIVAGHSVDVRWRRWVTDTPPRARVDARRTNLAEVEALRDRG